jgi:hypothetical protein
MDERAPVDAVGGIGGAEDAQTMICDGASQKFIQADVPDNMTVFAHLARKTPYRAAVRGMAEQHRAYRFLEIGLPDGLVEKLRSSVLDAMSMFGHSGWRRKDGVSPTYGGFSLAFNPDHQDNLDPNVSSLGTPQNASDKFYYNQRARNLPAKNSYFDSYGFRRRTPASQHSELGGFLDALRRPLVRSRVGIIYGERVDPTDENYRANSGWHRDEPIYENLRVNIPLQTDPNFVFEIEGEPPRHLEVGKAYSWDTHIPHRVYCSGPTKLERIHLVLGVAPWFDYDADDDSWHANEFFGRKHPFDLLLTGRIHPLLHA